jgi:hypothetical protein
MGCGEIGGGEMSQIKITPEMLNDLEHKARGTCDSRWVLVNGNEVKPDHYRWSIAVFPDSDDAKFVAAANPAVVLALVAEIERLRDRQINLLATLRRIKSATYASEFIQDLAEEAITRATEASNAD